MLFLEFHAAKNEILIHKLIKLIVLCALLKYYRMICLSSTMICENKNKNKKKKKKKRGKSNSENPG